jgi:hypothetical protein
VSVYELRSVWCSGCGTERTVKAVDSANPLRHPPFFAEMLDRSFHRSTCPHCGRVERLETPMLWTDVPHGLVAWLAPPDLRPGWSGLEVDVAVGLAVPTQDEGPVFVQDWGRRATLRLVFGLEELREKVVAARARIDDRVVEALKLPYGNAETARGPVLERVDESGLLLAEPEAPHGPVALVTWDAYRAAADALMVDPALAGLVDATWVHWLRAPFPRATPVTSPAG